MKISSYHFYRNVQCSHIHIQCVPAKVVKQKAPTLKKGNSLLEKSATMQSRKNAPILFSLREEKIHDQIKVKASLVGFVWKNSTVKHMCMAQHYDEHMKQQQASRSIFNAIIN